METVESFILGSVIVLLLIEMKTFIDFISLKYKKKETSIGVVSKIERRYNQNSAYFISVNIGNSIKILKLETGIISGWFSGLLGRKFDVLIDESQEKCYVKNILFYLLPILFMLLLLSVLFFIFLFY